MAEPRSATQVYRQVQRDQTLAHVARIQELEARVAELEAELSLARASGGSDELSRLPADVLAQLQRVFEAVPIPDLSAWESRQALQRLSGLLGSESLPQGCWSLADGVPALVVEEGDGATVARTVRCMAQVLAEVAARYLAQMIEFQGVTPDHVSRARASHLMDVSSQLDAKEQYALLPSDHQRQLFDASIEELIQTKDQLYTVTRWLGEARSTLRSELERLGGAAPANASLASVVEALVARQAEVPAGGLEAGLRALVKGYANLLPEPALLKPLELAASPWQERYQAASDDAADLPLLGEALVALLSDHVRAAAALRPTAVRARERKALQRLAKSLTDNPARARGALGELGERLQGVEQANADLQVAQRDLVKRHSAALEQSARARIAASERPQAAAAAFERLSKPERNAHLAGLWVQQVEALAELLGEGLDALQHDAHRALLASGGHERPEQIGARRARLERLRDGLREPPEVDELELTASIDVEDGLLARQAEDLKGRVAAFLGRYSKAKRAGMRTLPEAADTLAQIDTLRRGKKAALDAVLKKGHRGSCAPKQEAASAAALLEEQREVESGRARLADRKRRALETSQPLAAAAGLALPDWDTLWSRVQQELSRLDAAEATQAVVDARLARARQLAGALDGVEVESLTGAQATLLRAAAEAAQLHELEGRLQAERQAYLERSLRVLRKRPQGFDAARAACAEVLEELRLVDLLRQGERSYVAGFVERAAARDLKAVTSWVRRERKKAERLAELIGEGARSLAKAADKLSALKTAS
jgi:hypothetical protein